mmetsp:Transcript_96640/g.273685  ORF Transcript_96640/g.273685 Transcript_96640/m.273685 type:complete len:425 (+) Transcript_96640:57-1331(+)
MSSSDGHDEAEAAADERDMPAASGNNELIQGVAAVLREASAALARLGANPSPSGQQQPGGGIPNANLAGAAAALAQAASAIAFKKGGAVLPDPLRISDPLRLEEAPQMTVSEFVDSNSLDEWVGLALSTLTPTQRAAVVNPPLKVENTRNISGVVMSRIKQVAPVEQRIQMFVKVNDLGDGVVDRLSTLTTDECEAVMDSGMKIQKATNPSGVAMKRITDVLKKTRNGRGVQLVSRHEKPTWSKGREIGSYNTERRGHESESRHQSGHDDGGGRSYLPRDVQELMRDLGLEWWCGEVLRRLSLWQRQQITADVQNMANVRNPSGVVMSRVRQFVDVGELMHIFIDINKFDSAVQQDLWTLTPEQQAAVINPGIFLQNVRNPSTAVRSRINNVLAGNDAFGKPLRSDYDGNSAPFKDWRIQENLT